MGAEPIAVPTIAPPVAAVVLTQTATVALFASTGDRSVGTSTELSVPLKLRALSPLGPGTTVGGLALRVPVFPPGVPESAVVVLPAGSLNWYRSTATATGIET